MQYTLYVADSLAANETHTLWFLIFVKSTGGSVALYVIDSLSFNTYYYVWMHFFIVL